MLTAATFEFIEDIDRHTEPAALIASFQKYIGKFGMVYFLVGDPRPPVGLPSERLWATTWPEEWLTRWTNRNYLVVDPIVRKLRMQNFPVRWGPQEPTKDAAGSRILEEAGEFRMSAGLAVPIYSREGLSVIVSMGAEHYEIGKTEEKCLHMASIFLHAKLERLRAKQAIPTRQSRLAPRERECLSWVAAGKTDWEISQILNIAEQTVHEYVQNALVKFGATTRAQAVAIAISTKQISA
jgi:LuxR family quorum sensing-dependent transcriptional regulator